MAETTTAAPNVDTAVKTDTQAEKLSSRTEHEVREISSSIFRRRADQDPEARAADPAARKIFDSEWIGNVTDEQIGEGLKIGAGEALEGNPIRFLNEDGIEVTLTEVTGTIPNGKKDENGNDETDLLVSYILPDKEDKKKDSMPTNQRVSRQTIVEANLVSERAGIEAGFQGDELVVAKAYLDSIDHTKGSPKASAELDHAIENTAREQGRLTVEDLRGYLSHLPDAQQGKAQEMLANLNGTILLEPEDFHTALRMGGLDKANLGNAIIDLGQAIQAKEAEIAQTPDLEAKKIKEEELAELKGQQQIFVTSREALGEDNGAALINGYVENAQNGKIDQEKFKHVAEAFRNGDIEGVLTSVMDSVPELQIPEGMDPNSEEAKAIAARRKKVAMKVAAWGVGAPVGVLAVIALAIAAVGAVAIAGAASSGRR